MVFGIDDAIIAAVITAAASTASGYFAGKGQGATKRSKTQKSKDKVIDQLLSSLSGEGPYANLFATDEKAFQKSFVDPAKSIFKNQISPQIQQSYIASGQQRGTGLDDQLLRAGVDLDQLLNQQYMQFQESGKNRMTNVFSNILGQPGTEGSPGASGGQAFQDATSGYLSSDAFSNSVNNMFKNKPEAGRKGFEAPKSDFLDYGLNDPRWGK